MKTNPKKAMPKKAQAKRKKVLAVILSLTLIFAFCTPMYSLAANNSNTGSQSNKAQSSQNSSSQPPEKPDGSSEPPSGTPPDGAGGSNNGGGSGQTPPDGNNTPPNGEASGNNSEGASPGGNGADAGGPGGAGAGGPGGGQANTQSFDYSGSYNATLKADGTQETSTDESIEANEASTNVALAQNGGELTIDGDTLTKTGDLDDGDSCNFYGVNSASLAVGSESKMYISSATINSNASGANGVFATDNATTYVNNTSINSTKDNSRGLDATYGGTIIANSANIATKGAHCASVATDRGGGNISVANSQISTSGAGSPLFYSTGKLEANKVTGKSSKSQIACIEGLNSLLISNSNLESTQKKDNNGDGIANAIMIYQSTSGDADTSTGQAARMQVYNSTLKSAISGGSLFYFTNTNANVVLSNSNIDYDSDSSKLMTVAGNNTKNWGSAGKNGATVSFAARSQKLAGDISVDSISSLNFYLLDGSTYTGSTAITKNSGAAKSSSTTKDSATAKSKSAAKDSDSSKSSSASENSGASNSSSNTAENSSASNSSTNAAENSNTANTDEPITINISSDSKWIVTGNCKVSNLNAQDGAQIVDSDGKTVSIVSNGKKIVDGDSKYSITVSGTYSNEVNTTDAQELQSATIDRSDFDSKYATQTSFDGISEHGTLQKSSKDSNITAIAGGIAAALVLVAIICVVAYKTKGRKKPDGGDDGNGDDNGDDGGSDDGDVGTDSGAGGDSNGGDGSGTDGGAGNNRNGGDGSGTSCGVGNAAGGSDTKGKSEPLT